MLSGHYWLILMIRRNCSYDSLLKPEILLENILPDLSTTYKLGKCFSSTKFQEIHTFLFVGGALMSILPSSRKWVDTN